MKTITATIERNEDSFFAYIPELDGCVAGGNNYSEVKANLQDILEISIESDSMLQDKYKNGYSLKFEVDLQSVFKLLPELNITQLASFGDINPGLLRQYASGSKKASESQTSKIMLAIEQLALKLNSLTITA